jgi:VacB/RNase II family 3'-5' exoribonuclease
MTPPPELPDRLVLQRLAHRVMIERGLSPDFSPAALAELAQIHGPALPEPGTRDLRSLLWCSIDNDDSRDLDQLSVAEALPDGAVRALVAIADVDAVVRKQTALDGHARQNTTSVYTVAAIFPMLPEKLSTDLTSLGPDVDRLAMVADLTFARDGSLQQAAHYPALVRNRAKLAYNGVAAWLDGTGPVPPALGAVAGLDANLRLQDELTQKLKSRRHQHGALDLETIQARPIFEGALLKDLVADTPNRAKTIIEDLMIAANGATARYLASRHRSSLRRVVRTPKHWDLIVELAAGRGATLPADPDAAALEGFLVAAKQADPLRFPDLSLSVIKLLGAGEYVLERPGGSSAGHFGLAVRDYAHSTAPNRRFPDVITQRLLKAALADRPPPYADGELEALARHCTEAEDAAKKVERQVTKSGAALLLRGRVGEQFGALVTGASDKGTWVRVLQPPVEGRLLSGFEGAKVGTRLRVELCGVDVERGYIDFKRAGP